MLIASVGEPSVSRHYRSLVPLRGLHALGHDVALCEPAGPGCPRSADNPPQLATADVILGYRAMFANASHVQRTISRGAAFVWDVDDDLAKLPRESVIFRAMGPQGLAKHAQRLMAIARTADIITTTTPHLAQRWQSLGAKRTVVIPNFLERDAVRPLRPRERDTVTIGWVAAAEHKGDPKRVPIVKALRRLLELHPHVRVESIGVPLQLPADRYRHYSWVHISRLADVVATWDLGIAPLADIPFNRARSDVKLKEYGAAGVPWLASPVGQYVGHGEQQGGRLVPDHGWFDALDALVRDDDTRAALAANANAWARTQTIDHAAHLWEAVCTEAIDRRARRRETAA